MSDNSNPDKYTPDHEDYDALMIVLQTLIDDGEIITYNEGDALLAAKHLIRCWRLGLVTIGAVQRSEP